MINSHYFDIIDTGFKAYMLGFIYADGSIEKNGRVLDIKLALKDRDIIEKFAEELSVTTIYRGLQSGYPYIRLKVHNKYLVQSLIKLGIVHNKTYIYVSPVIPIIYRKNFLLGYFDGDGNIYGGLHASMISMVGHKKLMKLFQYWIYHEFGFYAKLKKQSNTIHLLRISALRKIVPLMEWLYEDVSFCLLRKKNIFCGMQNKYYKQVA